MVDGGSLLVINSGTPYSVGKVFYFFGSSASSFLLNGNFI